MKTLLKIVIPIGLLSFSLLFWQSQRVEQKAYIKNETYVKHLNQKDFLSKAMPEWMEEQINEDFQDFEKHGISKEAVDRTFEEIQRVFPTEYIVRYRILNNELYRYFRDGERVTLKDTSTEMAIKTLLHCNKIPNLDCIISFFDGIRPNHTFFHTHSKELQAPLLISAKIRETPYTILIPDYRSLGHWWISDIKHINSRMDAFPWERKKEFAVWRGTYNREERLTLCKLSLENPNVLDAKFNLPKNDSTIEAFMGESVSWEEFLECKYLPYVDGYMTASPALQWRLLSKSVTFKPTTDEVQWFHRALKPFVHYIPVENNLSNLFEAFDWAKKHDAECQKIGETASDFAMNHLMYENVLFYFNAVLNRYASLQKIDPVGMENEIKNDPHWVKIQFREELRKKAEEQQMVGFLDHESPGGGIISTSTTSITP